MFNSFPIPKPDSGGSNIKSAQRGSFSFSPSTATTATVTIAAIDPAKSFLRFNIVGGASANTHALKLVCGVLTNATTLTFSRGAGGATNQGYWEVIEFQSGIKSIQQVGGAAGIFTIAAVNLNKTICMASGRSTDTGTPVFDVYSYMQSETQVVATCVAPGTTVNCFVIEFS